MSFSLIANARTGAYIRTWGTARMPLCERVSGCLKGHYADRSLRIRVLGHAGVSLSCRFCHARDLLPSGQLAHGRNGAGQCSLFREELK